MMLKVMPEFFSAEEHWTSHLRTRAGFSTPTASDDGFAFTIKDTSGTWNAIMARSGIPEVRKWRSRPLIWHLIVKTTAGPLSSEFTLMPVQFDKAKLYAVGPQQEKFGIPSDVVLLVRVSNAQTEPQMNMFHDPWEIYLAGKLKMKSSGTYIGRISD